jgi:hypothetical protein
MSPRLATALVSALLASSLPACDQSVVIPARTDAAGTPSMAKGWVSGVGGLGPDAVARAAISPADGDLVVAGGFHGVAAFGGLSLVATAASGRAAFIAKLDASTGLARWATAVETNGALAHDLRTHGSMFDDVVVDGAGNVVLSTSFEGTITVGGKTFTSGGGFDGLIVKLDPSGRVSWARPLGGPGADAVHRVIVDDDGTITVTGGFHDRAQFGEFERTARGGEDVFVARLDATGTVRWVAQMGSESPGGSFAEYGSGLARAASGRLFVAGKLSGSASFGPFTLVTEGNGGLYLAELAEDGAIVHAEAQPSFSGSAFSVAARQLVRGPASELRLACTLGAAGATAYLATVGVAASPFGWRIAHVGDGQGTALVVRGSETVMTGTTLDRDVHVSRVDAAGRVERTNAGGPGDDGGNGIAIDKQGNLYVVGWFSATATFGGATLTSAGDYDGFVWKIPAPEP